MFPTAWRLETLSFHPIDPPQGTGSGRLVDLGIAYLRGWAKTEGGHLVLVILSVELLTKCKCVPDYLEGSLSRL